MSRDVFSEPWKEPEFDPTRLDPTLGLLDMVIEEIADDAAIPRLPVGPEGAPVAQLDEVLTNPDLATEARRRVGEAIDVNPPHIF